MAKRAFVLSGEARLGTAHLLLDCEKGKAGLQAFGQAGAGSVRQAATEMRVMEGNITNNTRAVGQFLITVLKVGPAVQAIFPLVGAVAFGGMLVTLAEHVVEFFTTIREGSQKSVGEWSKFTEEMHISGDEVELTNSKLKDQIAKLEGHPRNGLETALDEARLMAAKLGKQIDDDIAKIEKLFKEEDAGFLAKLFGGTDNSALEKVFRDQAKKLWSVNLKEEADLANVSQNDPNAKLLADVLNRTSKGRAFLLVEPF